MDEEIERLVVSVRADTGAFARDVADMRGQLEGPLAQGVERAGRVLENALIRAVRTGKLGFEDLKRVALAAMAEIAAAAIRSGIDAALGGGRGGTGSSLLQAAAQIAAAMLAAPGRATGGPVSPGRAYRVGERGP
jgi:phage-related minor tail protein